jgi:lipopolysaccharide export system permease protein
MPVLFRYCLAALGPVFLLATGFWLFILNFLFELIPFLNYLMQDQAGILNSLRLLLYIQPGFLILAIPIGFLTALLIVYGRFGADGELVALESCGFSVWVLVWPMIVVSSLLSLFLVVFMDILLPWGNISYLNLQYRIITERSGVIMKERVFIDNFKGYILYVDQKDDSRDLLKGVKVQVLNDKGEPYRTIIADHGVLRQDPHNLHSMLDLSEGTMQQVGSKKNNLKLDEFFQMKFKTCSLDLSANQLHNGPVDFRDPRNISMKELAAEIHKKKNLNQDTRYAELEFHKKFSLPFAALAFAFVGIPLGLTVRAGSFSGFFYAAALIVFYELFVMFGEAGGPMGVISPGMAMWLPNIVLIVIGMVLIYRLNHKHHFWGNPFRKAQYPSNDLVNSIKPIDLELE